MINTEIVRAKIELLSTKPGVYLMKNSEGTIIYVGKAKSLVKRVKQYFSNFHNVSIPIINAIYNGVLKTTL